MSSQVFYRKWRPSRFSDLAGQEHVTNTLRQAIIQNRVSHSYLFCGPRGTGKTTTARVLAKAVNCTNPQQGDPCNECHLCVSINDGRNMDIIELDAASNRGIDEIRDIRDRVHFMPAESARKVYIIDEAHMLTAQASNAFLKTLEEPPQHVIFILCTTEAHNILPTIISRCQRYDFRRLPGQTIYDRLAHITDQEAVAIQPDALRLVARNAGGSLRDAENILEQLVVSSGGEISLQDVEQLLGLGRSDTYLILAQALMSGDTPGALAAINAAVWEGADPRQMQRQTLDLLRSALLIAWNADDTLDLADDTLSTLRSAVQQSDQSRILRAVRIWAEANLRYDAPASLPLEVAAAEIGRSEPAAVPETSVPQPARTQQPAVSRRPPPQRPATPQPADRPPAAIPTSPPPTGAPPMQPSRTPAAAPSPTPGVAGGIQGLWEDTVRQLSRTKGNKYSLGALLRDCRTESVHLSDDGATLMLPFRNVANLDRMQEELADPKVRDTIEQAIEQCFGTHHPFEVTLVGGNGENNRPARNSAQDSHLLRTAIGLGARIVEDQQEAPNQL
ncbi:DNA polymerase III subunit gamma/tau [Geodia barretti]|uniref:DNA-directed DNA polymerase n=1 Tax=Geodia barretti TaxID=519541 RepID=A0AA35W9F7_GEOBA|nr:DNA polymerase III subunit gamma/tau [Geodia barretti]